MRSFDQWKPAWLRCAALCVVLIVSWAGIAQSAPDTTVVFQAGSDGYACFRIPAIVATLEGDLLAFAEGRHDNCSDTGNIDLVMRRSTDGGATWGSLGIIAAGNGDTRGNPAPLVDRDTGFVWLPFTFNRGEDRERDINTGDALPRTVWVTHSEDHGRTWSAPREISHQTRRDTWRWYATGPGHGIQLRDGTFLVPCDHSEGSSFDLWRSHVVLSSDQGATWEIASVLDPETNECMAAELADGRIYLNMRSYAGRNRRAVAWSDDGGRTWSPVRDDEALVEPVCQASLLALPPLQEGDIPVLFANPASTKREKLTVRLSRDGGQTWPVARELWAGPAAYSDLVLIGDDVVGCLYERGDETPYETIVFTRFTRDWLQGN